MAVDLGQSLVQGFNTGLSIRRNMEETAKLVREREQQEEADRLWKEAMEQQKPLMEAMRYKREAIENHKRKKAAGYTMKPEELQLMTDEANSLTGDYLQLLQSQSISLMQSGNPVAMGRAQEMLKQASDMFVGIGDLQERAKKRLSDESEGALDREVRRDEIAARQAEGKADRKVQRERIAADLKIQGLDDSPVSKMKQARQLTEGVAAMDGAGWSDDQIKKVMGPGFDPEMYREQWKAMSDETKAKVKEARGYLKDLEKRKEDGEDVDDLIQAQREEIEELTKEEREMHDSELRQRRYRRNTPIARRAADAFVNTLPGLLGSGLKTAHEFGKGAAEASGMRAEDLVPEDRGGGRPTKGSSREFDAPPSDFERPVAYPDEDGNYSVETGDF